MSFKLLGGGSDLNGVVSDMNQNILELKGREVTEVFKDDTGVRRVLSGKRGDDYGLFVSKPTFDVFSAADDELIFNSDQNVFKIVDKDTVTVTKAAGDNTAVESIPHGLGYAPIVVAYGTQSGTSTLIPLPEIVANISTGVVAKQTGVYVDATNIVFYLTTPAWVGNTFQSDELSYTFQYYILQETAN